MLGELRSEYRRIPNMDKRVFTKNGKAISKAGLRHGFEKAMSNAEIEDFQFRDFRHCARTRWAAAGLRFEVAENGMVTHQRNAGTYIKHSDDQVLEAWLKTPESFSEGSCRCRGTCVSYCKFLKNVVRGRGVEPLRPFGH